MKNSHKLFTASAVFVIFPILTHAYPTDNPVTTFYPGDPELLWTDSIAWSNVVTTAAIPNDGLDDLATVQVEINTLYNNGGGVLYFPPGTYNFSDDLMIKSRIVLRGATPGDGVFQQDPDAAVLVDDPDNAKSTAFALTTRFEFPKYHPTFTGDGTPNNTAFKKITVDLPRASGDSSWRFHAPLTSDWADENFGMVYIDVNRARIQMMPYTWKWGITQEEKELIKARNIIVFGCRVNNATMPDPDIGVSDSGGNNGSSSRWLRWPARQVGPIEIFTYRNAIIANNRINDKHYYEWGTEAIDDFWAMGPLNLRNSGQTLDATRWVGFYYTNTYGIKVNRSSPFPNTGNNTPMTEPSIFREGIAILDNFVFNTARPAIHAAGAGLRVEGNYNLNIPFPSTHLGILPSDSQGRKLAWVEPACRSPVHGSNTYENRLADVTGFGVRVIRNYGTPYQMRAGATGYTTTDGEGILHQEVGGGSPVIDWLIAENKLFAASAYIGIFKSRDIDGLIIRNNEVPQSWSAAWPSIFAGADTNNAIFSLRGVLVEGNVVGGIRLNGTSGGEDTIISNNIISGKNLRVTDYTLVSGNSIEPTLVQASNDGYDPLPVISWVGTYPASLPIASAVVLRWTVSDQTAANGDAEDPLLVEVYRFGSKLGEASKVGSAYEFNYVTTDEDGLYGIYIRAKEATGAGRWWYSGVIPWESVSSANPEVAVGPVTMVGSTLIVVINHSKNAELSLQGIVTLGLGDWDTMVSDFVIQPVSSLQSEIQIDLDATPFRFFRVGAD